MIRKHKMMKKALAFTLAFSMVSSLIPGTWMNSSVVKAATVTDVANKQKILEFDFEGADATGALKGKAYNGTGMIDVTAEAEGVTFADGAAIFPSDGGLETTGITYAPNTNEDPMGKLQGADATVSMWVKTGESAFNSTLFAYGARQGSNQDGALGASVQIVGRNNQNPTYGFVYYRDAEGHSNNKTVEPKEDSKSPYKQDEWQLVTLVETSTSLKLYIDGEIVGENTKSVGKNSTLKGYATDMNKLDKYYFGFLPYLSGGDSHFVGSMDSITVYDGALEEAEVELLYAKGMLQYAIDEADDCVEGDYIPDTWRPFKLALDAATGIVGTSQDVSRLNEIKVALTNAQAALKLQTFPKPILRFDFTGTNPAEALKGTARIGETETTVTATAPNVTFNGTSAVFSKSGDAAATSSVVYKPAVGQDPLAHLSEGSGATITMWVKSAESTFSSSIFSYGALQTKENNGGANKIGTLGASFNIVAVNGNTNTTGTVFYRDQSGSTTLNEQEGNGKKKIEQPRNTAPYIKDVWQSVTYVEAADGSGTFYVDGKPIGTTNIKARTLLGYAKDAYGEDAYYIGGLPYIPDGDTNFVGEIGGVTVYGEALTEERVQRLYEEGKIAEVIAEAAPYYNETKYGDKGEVWTDFKKAYDAATAGDDLKTPASQLVTLRTDLQNALAELKKATTEGNNAILWFDFDSDDVKTSKENVTVDIEGGTDTVQVVKTEVSGSTTVSGITAVTATVGEGIVIENGVAKFQRDPKGTVSHSTGITYKPENADGKDPMDALKAGGGATVSMWVKTGESELSSSLFTYGALQSESNEEFNGKVPGELGAGLQFLAKNNKMDNQPTLFSRAYNGKSNNGKERQIITAANKVPYKQGHWQLVTYVEEMDGTQRLYVDGVQLGEVKVNTPRTLQTYATDGYGNDTYYFGFLPYYVSGDTHFVGEMDSIAIYDFAFSQEEIREIYEKGQLEYTIKEIEAEEYTEGNYTTETWSAYNAALTKAKEIASTDAATRRAELVQAQDNLTKTNGETTVLGEAKAALGAAFDGLTLKDPAETNEAYTEDSWNEYRVVYNAVDEALRATGEEAAKLTSGDLKKLKTALEEARDALVSTRLSNEAAPLLEFSFDKDYISDDSTKVTGETSQSATVGIVTADVSGVTFKDGIATFSGAANAGITYKPEAGKDPMDSLESAGATIAMWIKSDAEEEPSGKHLFAYGALMEGGDKLGASAHIMAKADRPDEANYDETGLVYYRDKDGKTGDQKVNMTSSPYKVGTWQFVTFVETIDEDDSGNTDGTLYVDGMKVGSFKKKLEKNLSTYAGDKYADTYYIGYLPYNDPGNTNFKGSMDSVTIYDTALTQEEIQKLYDDYKEVLIGMEKENLNKLLNGEDSEIKATYDAGPSDYSDTSWDKFEGAYEDAEVALKETEVTVDEIVEVIANLEAAHSGLITKLDEAKGELRAFIDEVGEDYSADDYSTKSWETLTTALSNADTALNENSIAAIEDARKAIEDALEKLVTKEYDKALSELQNAINAATPLKDKGNDYASGFEDFTQKLTAAENAKANETDPAKLNKAASDLKAAQTALVTKKDKALTDLKAAITEADKLDEANYTPDKWPAFKDALTNAKNVAANGEATEAQLKEATTKLTDAQKALVSTAQNAFKEAYKNALGCKAADYTEESWSAFEPVRTAAEALLAATLTDDEWKAETKELTDAQAALVPKLRVELEGIIAAEEKKNYKEADYTPESWEAYTKALTEAKEKKDTASIEELETLKKNLEGAKLVTKQADAKSKLDVAVTEAKALVETNYTPETWAEFAKALTAAEGATDKTTLADLETLLTNLNSAIDGLEMTQEAALAALDKAVADAEAKGYNKDDYEETSWNNYQTALDAAKARDEKADAATLTGLKDALVNAENALVTKAFAEAKEALDGAIEEIEAKDHSKDDYDETSWKAYEEALNNAKNPPAGATPEDIENLQAALEAAEAALVSKEMATAKANLDTVVKEAETKNEADYTPESWTAFKAALEAAKAPAADATPEDIAKLQKDLEDASAALVTKTVKAAKDALAAAVNSVAALNQADYTPESWAVFQAALNAAKAPAANATEEQLKKLQTDLQAAVNGLKKSEAVQPPVVVQPTEEENQIASQYGVTVEVAKQIIEIIKQYKISNDVSALTDKYVTSVKNDKDVKGSTFNLLQARATKQTANSVKLKWNKVSGADGYLVYGAKCGDAYKLLTTTGKTSYSHKKLNKATYYKYLVLAYKDAGGAKVTMAAAKTVHTVTTGGSFGVAKKVDAKASVTVGVKKTYKLKAKEIKDKLKIKTHRKLKYESSDTTVATVSGSGKIKAKKKGKCYVYAYAQNGIFKKINVIVK